ncbi:hypothetical protein M011DRAFT_217689 [Sporormia fimetaria CBS 119925]|uniref:Uncharacterized protein n=1 Tax=Sporormia fimetaria CBS 119925 TaxID=1340428 RepID=A0A6A6V1T4_9PLEO|nr:hypothetical protein M011DRAFT_217689 [Sporormia fimetaria CBS 119925]
MPPRMAESAWTHHRGRKQNPRRYREPGLGCSSLHETALRCCVWYIDDFVPETFEAVEWGIAERIYQKLKKTDTLTWKSWVLFRTVYRDYVPPTFEVSLYFKPDRHAGSRSSDFISSLGPTVSKITFSCLTLLSIRGIYLKGDDNMSLINVPNLVVLDLAQHKYLDTDSRSLRIWGRAVDEKQAFRRLKVAVFAHFRAPPEDIVRAVTSFPALCLLGIHPLQEYRAALRDYRRGQAVPERGWCYWPKDQ